MQHQKAIAKTTVRANKNDSTNVGENQPNQKNAKKIDKIMINNAKKTREMRPSFSSYCKKDV